MPTARRTRMDPKPKWASEEDFKTHRESISELYHNNLTLPRIMETMEIRHGFFATTKMYKTRFRRWGLWKHCSSSSSISNKNDGNIKYRALVRHTIAPDEWHQEEMLYRAIRDYYDGAFLSRRWVFEFGTGTSTAASDNQHEQQLATQRTSQAIRAGDEIYVRFRAAVFLLERPFHGNNRGKAGDFAQGVRLMRISFAEVSRIFLGGTEHMESPMMVLWLIYIMVMFRESSARDFQPVEAQLLRHLCALTSLSSSSSSSSYQGTSSGERHPTADLWLALCSGGRGQFASDRHFITACAEIAIERFSHHIGYFHPWTVNLSGLAIGLLHPNGAGPAEDKTMRFRDLLQNLESETGGVYDLRHINTICCWASHCRHHGCRPGNPDLGMLEEGIALLEGVLDDPVKGPVVEGYPDGAFNMYSLLTRMHHELKRSDVAERYMRRGADLARRQWERTGEDCDLFEGLNGLEVVLRAQGKIAEADAVLEERKKVVRDRLEMVGEKEDSA